MALDDPDDCNQAKFDNRDIDQVYVFDDVANQRIFVKYETYGNAGWPKGGKGIYKWAIDTAGQQAAYSSGAGTHFDNAEYVLYVWDNGFEDEIGEMNLVDVGLDQSDKDAVQLKTPADIGPHTACGNDCVGTLTDTNGNGEADLGEPQIANNNPDIGYRLSGNQVEMYVSYSAIGVTWIIDLCLVGVGESTATNYNLDQASSCDNTKNGGGGQHRAMACSAASRRARSRSSRTPSPTTHSPNRFELRGPSDETALVQDPGISECVDPNPWGVCGTVPPWDREDRVSYDDLKASNHPFEEAGPTAWSNPPAAGATLEAYATTWECRNVDPDTCSQEIVDGCRDPFALPACAPIDPPARCEAEGWIGGVCPARAS